ncbi:MAG TPA: hypothetical protein VFT43_01205 [Candidatus Polarisedimenticolia bacterium]|nr:hypothetical protein [Candidatus Polarisedimenticolia bacterium]
MLRSIGLLTIMLLIANPASGLPQGVLSAPPLPQPPDPIEAGMGNLHQGLYSQAEEMFRSVASRSPDDPEARLFIAYSLYWRILEEPKNRDRDDAFMAAIDEVEAVGDRRLEKVPDDLHAMAMVGAAHVLRAHIEALRHSYFHGAQEARRGKKLLEAALLGAPGMKDALFLLGTFNYYADRVPAVVKGIRALLFLPGGDAELGMAQLRAVANSPTRFRTDARMILAAICGSREERCYTDALAHLHLALQDDPDSPIILGWLAAMQTRLGAYGEAASTLVHAVEVCRGEDPDRVRQRRRLRIFQAEALVGDWRMDEAEAALRAAGAEGGLLPEVDRQSLSRVESELAFKRLGASNKALAHFMAGRVAFLAGRYGEAESELAISAGLIEDPPAWMEGWTELYRGLAQNHLGNEREARAHFRRASEVRKFRAADRALQEMRRSEPASGYCTP